MSIQRYKKKISLFIRINYISQSKYEIRNTKKRTACLKRYLHIHCEVLSYPLPFWLKTCTILTNRLLRFRVKTIVFSVIRQAIKKYFHLERHIIILIKTRGFIH